MNARDFCRIFFVDADNDFCSVKYHYLSINAYLVIYGEITALINRRGTEEVVTGSTRNRFVSLIAGHVGSNPTLSAKH